MVDKILVMTDNSFLANRFCQIISEKKLKNLVWDFGISPFSVPSKFGRSGGFKFQIINLKRSEVINKIIKNYRLILSLHCQQLFPDKLIKSVRCINVHPGYNPYTRGWYPQVFAIIKELPIGATIHEMDTMIDHGRIICRAEVNINSYDTSESLYKKIIHKELELLNENIEDIIKGNYEAVDPEEEGNLFLKRDFLQLCKFDLNETMSALDWINRLRALSHEEFKNAYFLDPVSKKKVYMSIKLTPDE